MAIIREVPSGSFAIMQEEPYPQIADQGAWGARFLNTLYAFLEPSVPEGGLSLSHFIFT